MKLRLKLGSRRELIAFGSQDPSSVRLKDVKREAETKFESSPLTLSLNGTDALTGDGLSMKDLGIVSGDLIQVMTQNPVVKSAQDTKHLKPQTEKDDIIDENKMNKEQPDSQNVRTDDSTDVNMVKVVNNIEDVNMVEDASRANSNNNSDSEIKAPTQDNVGLNKYLNEPMLCRDATDSAVPYRLEMFYNESSPRNPMDALCIVLHTLMIESGFQLIPPTNEDVSEGATASSLNSCNQGNQLPVFTAQPIGVCTFSYTIGDSTDMQCSITCVSIGSKIAIHGTVKGTNVDHQLNLKISDFIPVLKPDAAGTYQNLPRLSCLFKDAVAYRLLQQCKSEFNHSESSGFLGLMEEILMCILSKLPAKDLCNMGRVCRSLNQLSERPQLWRSLYIRTYGVKRDSDRNQDWKSAYKDTYLLRREMRRRALEQSRQFVPGWPPYVGQPHPPLPATPIYPPGFIGGEYDRDPSFQGIPGPLGARQPGVFPRPRFDPIGPLPTQRFPPGRGGGFRDGSSSRRPFSGGGIGPGNFF
ncbi:unnamed protein product [Owenia fusiformis]|uniref:F-box domain-containing protein n=1 Tax=Owenia fusiformis TaxID=6347 RepID=A0A8S4NQA8_OWEFU|nr:unnamed protein product [Owenia fusiformis]